MEGKCGVGISKVFDLHVLLLEISVKEGIVHGFSVFQQDNAQCPLIHAGNPCPLSYSTVGLPFFTQRPLDHLDNPFVTDHCSIWP
jgi:hypothetical protein